MGRKSQVNSLAGAAFEQLVNNEVRKGAHAQRLRSVAIPPANVFVLIFLAPAYAMRDGSNWFHGLTNNCCEVKVPVNQTCGSGGPMQGREETCRIAVTTGR